MENHSDDASNSMSDHGGIDDVLASHSQIKEKTHHSLQQQ
jgi:hypothetical protein